MTRSVIVTGGASGIGAGIVSAALAAGWRVAIFDLDNPSLQEARARLEPRGVLCIALDVTDETAVAEAVTRVEAELGPLAGLVNSAGIGLDAAVMLTTPQQLRRVLDVNVVGSFLMSREAARVMRGREGAIVNISSVSGIQGNEGRVAYGASKGAMNAMTRVMAVELAPLGLRVNAVAPGPVDTPMARQWHGEEVRQGWINAVPMRRYASVEEIAGAALFLLEGSGSSYITGQVLAVDGGFTIGGLSSGTTASANAGAEGS
ncbi:SDR family NAD(P)-dependent oxidoreductase [Cereibacter changlensis]|uniref:NAD(P)-dependent dehydrogenase (Short-subunit alcohol dehydrogenase family) n=1 Tax=Cereibacter changlensis TaxID=402884 RepID=A0A2W7RB24_9RHOB|nr:SDR family oxidoreductase [Cereibacter changlensis]PZX47855.1 NAD(P)-dependent dehydrogenase (short-subunit alcohol dehydrogenase family) [Cereibacter changlensis]